MAGVDKVRVPVVGCFVKHRVDGTLYRVKEHRVGTNKETRLCLGRPDKTLIARVDEVCSGIRPGMVVQDVPLTRVRKSQGEGEVVATRVLAGHEQVLVELFAENKRVWFPFENLARVRDPRERLAHCEFQPGLAERLRLRNLAFALEQWNENTGALSRLDIDPLPHQIHLVHHILASGNLNWFIADDVGLGKTIEVGMLLSALRRRRGFERILIVCPPGLTQQWQEELGSKFGMDDFGIYGRDFHIRDPQRWPLHPRVIASIDQLKHESHLPLLEASEHWDIVIFDEAHRLSRRQYGHKFEATERYKLALALRNKTDHMLLLSATPHQGRRDLFVSLLELLRPEWKDALERLELEPELLRECVYRNRKADVTDVNGQFVFQGQHTRAIAVPVGEAELLFDRRLQEYLRRGYQAASEQGRLGFAIGFVMTVFRKLAASSHAAILLSLQKRRQRLGSKESPDTEVFEKDGRFEGENEEELVENSASAAFFEGELQLLNELIAMAERLVQHDRKLGALMDTIVPEVIRDNPQRKLLIFTEYRGTQAHLREALVKRFGDEAVVLIRGGMTLDEKIDAVQRFNSDAQFMVSTEAGGEGLNLHRRCHLMVNYDLPWNPMRLVQRVGRLYRYGQQHKVVVFNLHAPQTLDGRVVEMMYERIDQVVDDMAGVSQEFNENLREEIFGELADLVNVEGILKEARQETQERTTERIAQALERAKQAQELQREVLSGVKGYNPEELKGALSLGKEHLRSFVLGMLRELECEVRNPTHQGDVYEVVLSEEVAKLLGRRARVMRIAFVRRHQNATTAMMDMHNPLMKLLMERARAHSFEGLHASVVLPSKPRALFSGLLRWQNDQGRRMREEFALVTVDKDGNAEFNSQEVVSWLARPARDGVFNRSSLSNKNVRALVDVGSQCLEGLLSLRSNAHLHPEQLWWLSAAWGGG